MAAADASIFGFPTAERTNLKTLYGFYFSEIINGHNPSNTIYTGSTFNCK